MKNLKKLTILHSNDLHGDFLAEEIDSKLVGGVSMLSGYVNKVRNEEKNAIYCIAGDMFRGSVIDSEYQGVSTIEIMNMLSPDVVTVGNHETDYGVAHLLFIEKCAKFPIINANLHIKTNGARLFKPHHIIEIDGMKVLFIGILTEHFAGAFPTWLAPVQARVLPITDKFNDYAYEVASKLEAAGVRVEVDSRNEKIGYKIRESQMQKVPYMLVVGEKEATSGTVGLRKRGEGDLGAVDVDQFVADIAAEIKERK